MGINFVFVGHSAKPLKTLHDFVSSTSRNVGPYKVARSIDNFLEGDIMVVLRSCSMSNVYQPVYCCMSDNELFLCALLFDIKPVREKHLIDALNKNYEKL